MICALLGVVVVVSKLFGYTKGAFFRFDIGEHDFSIYLGMIEMFVWRGEDCQQVNSIKCQDWVGDKILLAGVIIFVTNFRPIKNPLS